MYEDLDTATRVYLIYCGIADYKHWVRESTSIDKFFDNLDRLQSALEELCTIEYDGFYHPTPSEELQEITANYQKYCQAFFKRYWNKTLYEASKLKTEKGKQNKVSKFFESIGPYKERLSEDTITVIKEFNADSGYNNTYLSKSEKDKIFIIETDKLLSDLTKNKPIFESTTEEAYYNFFVKNKGLLERLFQTSISDKIFDDLCRLYIIYPDYRKIKRYLKLKYDLTVWFALPLSLAPSRIITCLREYNSLKHLHTPDEPYTIITHSAPCHKCREQRGKTYRIKEAKMTINFPPFCVYGCSSAVFYQPEFLKLQKPLSIPDTLFADAIEFNNEGKYSESAEAGFQACLLVPNSERYIQRVPEMLANVERYKDAVQVLNAYISATGSDEECVITLRDKYQRKAKQ